MIKKRLFNFLKYFIFLGIGAFLVWWQLGRMTPEEKKAFNESLFSAEYIWLLPVALMSLLSHLVRALRWRLLIAPTGKTPSVSNTFYATLAGYFGNTFVPRAGEILRCTLLGRYEGIPFNKLIGTIIMERSFDLLTYFLIIILTVAVEFEKVSTFVTEKFQQIFASMGGVFWIKLLVGILVLLLVYFLVRLLMARYAATGYAIKFKEFIAGLREGVVSILHMKRKGLFILLTLLMWGLYHLQIYIAFNALQVTENLGLGAALSVLTLTTLAMIISPGGLGAFPVAVHQVLLIYGIYNISFGWLMWGANTAVILIFGLLAMVIMVVQNKNNYEKMRFNRKQNLSGGGIGNAGASLEIDE